MDLKDKIWKGLEWISLDQERDKQQVDVDSVMNTRVPCNEGNFFDHLKDKQFTNRDLLH